MTGMWMVYAAGVGLLLGAAAAALDPLLRSAGRPRRWIWAAAMGASLVLPVASAATRSTPEGPAVQRQADPGVTVPANEWSVAHAMAARIQTTIGAADPYVVSIWIAATALLALALGGGLLRLRARTRAWPTARIAGTEVLLTDGFGPALTGVVRPRIAVPRWMLGLDKGRMRLAIWHEEEHRAAGDAPLLLAGVLAVVVAPWNPALWWQLRRLRAAVEFDCDHRVLRRGAPPVLYGSLLFELGTGVARTPLPVPALVPSPSLLERRLIMITRSVNPTGRIATTALVMGAVLAVVAACEAVPPVEPQLADEARVYGTLRPETGEGIEGSLLAEAQSRAAISLRALGSDAPLLYVDGIRMDNAELDDLDPNSIERIEVIKGQAAKAVFGSAASNGVIQIFMKPQG